ncbi:MAG: hypothetical protein IK079_02645 [Desulfovibrio sp.]|nr:hypothetical protein [Desulfovibrio sp.]
MFKIVLSLALIFLGSNVYASEKTELWSGSIYTSTFRCGICTRPDGQARGVLLLKTMFGQVDVYHLYGSIKNGKMDLRHSSGHHVQGVVTGPESVKGTITLGTGRVISFTGKRKLNVPLTADCSPLD